MFKTNNPEGASHYVWLKFDPIVPEYSRHDVNDLDYLIDWNFAFEQPTPTQRNEFIRWLFNLPLGMVVTLPNHDEYTIVRVLYSADAAGKP